MERSALDSLTEQERNALLAYHEHRSRQGAAHALGKSESTIASQLLSARRKLGVASSEVAAEQVAHATGFHPSRTKSRWLIGETPPPDSWVGSKTTDLIDENGGVREIPMPFGHQPPDRSLLGLSTGVQNDLTTLSATTLSLIISVGLIITIIATPSLVDSFKRVAAWIMTFYQ